MVAQGIMLYVIVVIVIIGLLVASLFIPFYGFMQKRLKGLLLGCLLQPVVFSIVAAAFAYGVYYFLKNDMKSHRSAAMVTIRQGYGKNESTRYASYWYLKADGECFYEYGEVDDTGLIDLDGWDDSGLYDVVRLDSTSVCVDDVIVVTFDLKRRQVSAVNGTDSLEVVAVDWERVNGYLRSSSSQL